MATQPEISNFYENFLTTFLQTGNGLAINSMWVLFFNNIPDTSTISTVTTDYGANTTNLSNAMNTAKTITNNTKGLVIAQGVKINGENLNVDRKGFKNTGYIQGMIGNGREGFPTLDISILENNISFVDYFLRPWVVAVGHKSLKDQTLKSDITVWFLGKGGIIPQNPFIRKAITYKNCRPISINQQEYNYSGSDMVKERPVSFVYTHYEMTEPDAFLMSLVNKPTELTDSAFTTLNATENLNTEYYNLNGGGNNVSNDTPEFNANFLQRIVTNLAGNVADKLQDQINKVRSFVLTTEERGIAALNTVEKNAINSISSALSLNKADIKISQQLSAPSGTASTTNTNIKINPNDTSSKTLKINQIVDPANDIANHLISPAIAVISTDDTVLATTPLKTYTEKTTESVDNVTLNTILKFNDYRTDTNDVPSSLQLMQDTKKPNASDTPDSKSITYTVKSINSGDTP